MLTVVIVIHLMIVAAMIGLVLLQKSEGGGLGMGGGGGGFLTSRGTSNVLTRTTAILAAGFFATSLVLSIIASWERKPRSILQPTGAPTTQQAPGTEPNPSGLLDRLKGAPSGAPPAAPAAPSEPQVPRSQ
ncbi:MAG: preprotein translocase subunit SecG [Hyphomicrobiales bacterium]|jgi:preprotein translocase subunit SecG|nr:preprotein translocase subunit SecG [Hyphomicrobiales bacterium]